MDKCSVSCTASESIRVRLPCYMFRGATSDQILSFPAILSKALFLNFSSSDFSILTVVMTLCIWVELFSSYFIGKNDLLFGQGCFPPRTATLWKRHPRGCFPIAIILISSSIRSTVIFPTYPPNLHFCRPYNNTNAIILYLE